MKVSELKAKQGNVDIVLDIVELGEAREFSKFGKQGKVVTAVAKDDSGQIKLTLWNEQIEKVKAGDKIAIKNGYVNEWQGDLQITTGRMGTLEVVGKAEPAPSQDEEDKKKEEDKKATDEMELNVNEESIRDDF
ncbi:MAG: hypothetical protein GY861_07095 [bacterium]|nr:hypothetical protein [bacterium]